MTAARRARANARLPPETARKLAYLERRTGKSTTEILIESIERYYAAATTDEGTAAQQLAGFVGCSEGPATLSETYKRDLARSWAKK